MVPTIASSLKKTFGIFFTDVHICWCSSVKCFIVKSHNYFSLLSLTLVDFHNAFSILNTLCALLMTGS